MQFAQLNRAGAENVYRTILNSEGATITTGLPVSLVNTTTDGIRAVIANATADYPGFIGISLADTPNNDYGRVQVNGWVDSIYISNVGTSLTISANDPLVPAPGGMFSAAPTYANAGFRYAHASNLPVAVSATAYASGLIKAIG